MQHSEFFQGMATIVAFLIGNLGLNFAIRVVKEKHGLGPLVVYSFVALCGYISVVALVWKVFF